MVARIWHGYTNAENADIYENFLKNEFLPDLAKKKLAGYKKFQLLRKSKGDEVAFTTIMWFDSLQQIKQFAGEDFEKSVVLPKAQALLDRYDDRAEHYELRHELGYGI